jgi:predicted GNAT family N-acyltransferase
MRTTMKSQLTIKKVSSENELQQAFRIRIRVFVREQGVPADIELDEDDKRALHLLAFIGTRAIGTARIVMRGGQAKIGRMAVLKSHRRKKVGKKLLTSAITTAKKQGARKIYLHAQVPVVGFYESAGFRCVGPVFEEAGIAHRKMVLKD